MNGKSYVGQTINPHQRMNAHKSAAFNSNSLEYSRPLYRDVRKYGWDNFEYEVLEECEVSGLVEREQYYIEKFCSGDSGYNIVGAGEDGRISEEYRKYYSEMSHFKNASLDFEDVVYIRKAYLNGKKPSEIYPEFQEQFSHYYSFMNVWAGARYSYVMPEVFNIRENRVKLNYETAQEIRSLYKEVRSYQKIAVIYGVGRATIRDVIKEHTWKPKEPVSTIPS